MANRVLISVQEDLAEPSWINKVEDFIKIAMKELNFDGQELSVFFCNDDYIQQLNKMYRNIDSATDVLSFENSQEYEDQEGQWLCIGDIVISLDTLPVNADYFNVDVNTELKRLLIHGLLHLNGMDHDEEHIEKGVEPKCEMLLLQEKLLKKLEDEKIVL